MGRIAISNEHINAVMQDLGVTKTRTGMIESTDPRPIKSHQAETTLATFWYGDRQAI